MKVSTMFPSSYLKAADFELPTLLTMKKITTEDVGGDHKSVLYFVEKDKGHILNKTNANTIAAAYGDDTDGWWGKQIVIYPSETDFEGKRVACIRMRKPKAAQKPAPVVDDMNGDEVPF